MSDPEVSPKPNRNEGEESFADMLSQYEQTHKQRAADGSRQVEATVISVSSESVFFDIGYKTEGVLPLQFLRRKAAQAGR